MKSLLLKSFVFYTMVMVISVTIQGCCENEYRITGNGTFEVFDKGFGPIDTINDEFYIRAYFEIMEVGMQNNFSLINSALATSCGEKYLNELLTNTVKLSLDKPFNYDGKAIEANSNFINIDSAKLLVTTTFDGVVEIRATTDFLSSAAFEKGQHIFHIYAETTDGLVLENELSVYFDL